MSIIGAAAALAGALRILFARQHYSRPWLIRGSYFKLVRIVAFVISNGCYYSLLKQQLHCFSLNWLGVIVEINLILFRIAAIVACCCGVFGCLS